jgi:hypothetical protein
MSPGALNTLTWGIRSFPQAFQKNSENTAKSKVVTVVLLRIQVLWGVMLCRGVCGTQGFELI